MRPQPLQTFATIQEQEPTVRRDRGHEEHLSWWQGTVTSSGHRLGDQGLLLLCRWPWVPPQRICSEDLPALQCPQGCALLWEHCPR